MPTPSPNATAYTPLTSDGDPVAGTRARFAAYLAALDARADFAAHFADDVDFAIVGGPSARGRPETERLIRAIHEQSFDARIRVVRTTCERTHAVAELVFTGTHTGEFAGHPATRRPVEVPYAAAYTFGDDGRITVLRVYMPMQVLMAQLGAG
jgi:steroid delta-isomerase-like uncharacterized protein